MSAGGHEDAGERVRELLEVVVEGLGLRAEVSVHEHGDAIDAEVRGDDLGLLIGRHGQTIDAVQHLAYKVAGHGTERRRVVVDAAGYRDRRREALERQADDAAQRAADTQQEVALDAMGANDRKLVHEYLKSRGDVETGSEGTEPNRHLVVRPNRFM